MAGWMIASVGLLHTIAAISLFKKGDYALAWTMLCYGASAIGLFLVAQK